MGHPYQDDDAYWDERVRKRNAEYERKNHPERFKNNPNGEPCGPYTGRCQKCGSTDLWTDNLHYGCNACGAFLG